MGKRKKECTCREKKRGERPGRPKCLHYILKSLWGEGSLAPGLEKFRVRDKVSQVETK